MKEKDKYRIQHNIDDCPDQRCHHPQEREALRCDKIVHPHGEQCEDRPRRIDRHIVIRIGKGNAAGPEPVQEIVLCQKEQDGQYDRDNEHQRKAVSQDPPRALLIPGAEPDRKQDRAADPEQRPKGRKERDDRRAYTSPGKRIRSRDRDIPDVNPVDDAVEDVHELSEHERDRYL